MFRDVIYVIYFLTMLECKGREVREERHLCSCEPSEYDNTTLSIHCEQIEREKIRDCFMRYNRTKTLILRRSHMDRIPDEIDMLKHVENVDFSENELRDLKFPNQTCRLLREINVNFNNIKILKSGSLDCFTNLHTLAIANNSLKLIEPGAFNKKLNKFRKLNAQYNDLEWLDSGVVSMVDNNITIIVNVSFNKISYFTNEANMTIMDINKSETICFDLMHNNFTRINITYYRRMLNITNILQLYNLWNSGFDIRFNPLICDCAMYEISLLLRIFRHMDPNNPFFSFSCYDPPSLRGMKVYSVQDHDFNCSVSERCPKECSCIETISFPLVTISCGDSYNSTRLPLELPLFKNIRLNIVNSDLSALEHRPYLTNVTELDISHNKVGEIDPNIVPQLDMIQRVYINDNFLSYLPRQMENMNFIRLLSMTLDGNQFRCDCHSKWLKIWLLKHKDRIPNQDKILCVTTGVPIVDTDDSNFVCLKPVPLNLILALAFVGFIILGMVPLVLYINRTRIQVFFIAKFNIHCCKNKVKTNLKYDIFLSHSSLDDDIVFSELIPKLENHDPPFKLCRDDRDFTVGKTIASNIITNIESSLTTLLVISNNFLQSEWCRMEFKQAHLKLLTEKRANLIMIMLETPKQDLMDKELKYYVKTNVYLNKNDKYFWPKLFQALPIRESSDNSSSSISTSVQESSVSSFPSTSSSHASIQTAVVPSMVPSRTFPTESTPLLS